MTRKLSLTFGLLISVFWMAEVIFGNLGDTTVLGNFRTLHFHTYRIVGWLLISGALLFTMLAGFFGAYRTGSVSEGLSFQRGGVCRVWQVSTTCGLGPLLGLTLGGVGAVAGRRLRTS